MLRSVRRILEIERPDVVHTHNVTGFSPAIWKEVKRHGVPLVHTLHDHQLSCFRTALYRRGRACTSRCFDCRVVARSKKPLSAAVDAVIGVSHSVLDHHDHLGFFPRARRRRVIPNASPVPPCAERRRASDALRVGYLGQLHPGKGIELLLCATEGLTQGRWEVKVGGRGAEDYVRTLRERFECPSVRFLGFVRPDDFFREVDVLVVPSIWTEAAPMVIREAYARGVPVVGSNRGGVPELVEEGETGVVFDPDRPETLRRALERLMGDRSLLARMGERAVARAAEAVPAVVARRHVDLYGQLRPMLSADPTPAVMDPPKESRRPAHDALTTPRSSA
ncbi:MAG: glycosyltransferase [Candidatus Rokubacteria bacterium]|nr:glycosyltransferase [Candidatus Rokubacteria bacterium]